MQFKNIILSFIASAVVINAVVIPNPPGAPAAPALPATPDVPNQNLPELGPNYKTCVDQANTLLGGETSTIDNAAKSASLCQVCTSWAIGSCLVYGDCYTAAVSYCFSFNNVGPIAPRPKTPVNLPVPTAPAPAVPAPPGIPAPPAVPAPPAAPAPPAFPVV